MDIAKTFAVGAVVALGTFITLFVAAPAAFASLGSIYPMFVSWAAGSAFALARQPRHGWFHVAALGLVVALLVAGPFRLRPLPPGASRGGPNMPMPAQPPPQR